MRCIYLHAGRVTYFKLYLSKALAFCEESHGNKVIKSFELPNLVN